MTKKEQQKMRRLELENEHLRDEIEKQLRIYGENVFELIDLRAKIQLVREALEE